MRHLLTLLFLCLLSVLTAQSWQPTTSPPDFLTDHTFGFALDGMGYLVTGTTEFDGPTDAFLQYDPVADSWTTLGAFPGPARGYGIGDVWEGKAYFGFGTSTVALLRDLWVFDPATMQWSELAECPCEPRLHPTFVAHNGKVFVGLGNNNGGNQNDWWEYDIATDSWSQKPDFPGLRRHHPYQFAMGDYVYAGLGHGNGAIYRDMYRYDPVAEEWSPIADIPGEGRVAGTQFSYNDIGYVLSGDGEDHFSMETGEFWAYNPNFDSWDELPPHPGKSRWAPSTFIINGEVYLFNGTTYFEATGSVYQSESYKFSLDSLFTSISPVVPSLPLAVYPNPTHDLLTLGASDFDVVSVYSLTHEVLRVKNVTGAQLNVSTLLPGLYTIRGVRDDRMYTGLFVKK